MSAQFKTELCDCCGSLGDCFIGFFLPCIETGLAAYNGGEGTFCAGVQCLLWPFCLPYLRYRIRESQAIEGNVCEDMAVGWCCPCCAGIQLKREFDN